MYMFILVIKYLINPCIFLSLILIVYHLKLSGAASKVLEDGLKLLSVN